MFFFSTVLVFIFSPADFPGMELSHIRTPILECDKGETTPRITTLSIMGLFLMLSMNNSKRNDVLSIAFFNVMWSIVVLLSLWWLSLSCHTECLNAEFCYDKCRRGKCLLDNCCYTNNYIFCQESIVMLSVILLCYADYHIFVTLSV